MFSKFAATYAATALVLVLLDLLWLGLVARSFYQQGIGHLMADQPRWGVALIFYLVYAAGIVLFAVSASEGSSGFAKATLLGALFGLFAYATYDLTNLATLKGWPMTLSLVDMAWGSFVSAASAVAGKWMLDRFAGG